MVEENRIRSVQISETDHGFTLIEFFQYLWKNFILILGIIITTVVVGVIYTWFIATPMYTSTADLMFKIGQPKKLAVSKIQRINEIKLELPTYIENFKSKVFLDEVIENANKDGKLLYETEQEKNQLVNKLQRVITITNPKDQLLLKFSVTSADPEEAYLIVKYVSETAKALINFTQYDEDESVILSVSNILISEAFVPSTPSSPNKILNVIISFMVGVILAVVVVLLKEQFSNHFKSSEEIEKLTGYPIIGEIFEQTKQVRGE